MRKSVMLLFLGAFLLADAARANPNDQTTHPGGETATVQEPCQLPRVVHHRCSKRSNPVVDKWARLRELQAEAERQSTKALRDQAEAAEATRTAVTLQADALVAKSRAADDIAITRRRADDEIAAANRNAAQAIAEGKQAKDAAKIVMDQAYQKLDEAKSKMTEATRTMAQAKELMETARQASNDAKAALDRAKDMQEQATQKMSEAERKVKEALLLEQATAKSTGEALLKAHQETAQATNLQQQARNEIATQKDLQAKSKALNDELENKSKLLTVRWEKIFDGMRSLDPCKAGEYAEKKPGS